MIKTKHNAFISYSHEDKDIVKKIQKSLEKIRIPSSVKKETGIERLDIAMDDLEFAFSPNLTEEIEKHLLQSDCLILICSDTMLNSIWCYKELCFFLKMKKNCRIIPIFLYGNPEFLSDRLANLMEQAKKEVGLLNQEPVSPLYWNLSSDISKKEWRTGILKLAAGIINTSLDDFVQRYQKDRLRRKSIFSISVFLILLLLIIGFNVIKRQRLDIDQSKSQNVAAQSEQLLKAGNRMEAVKILSEYIEGRNQNNIYGDVELNLQRALNLYTLPGNEYTYINDEFFTDDVVRSFVIDENGVYLAAIDYNNNDMGSVYLWNTVTRTLVAQKKIYMVLFQICFLGKMCYILELAILSKQLVVKTEK